MFRAANDVVLSFYNFLNGWFFDKDTIDLDAFVREFWLTCDSPSHSPDCASYFHHVISWYERRNDDNVMIVFFEDLKENLEREVRRVAQFISTDKVSSQVIWMQVRFTV